MQQIFTLRWNVSTCATVTGWWRMSPRPCSKKFMVGIYFPPTLKYIWIPTFSPAQNLEFFCFFNKLSYSYNVSTYPWVKVHWSTAPGIPDYLQRRLTVGRTRLNPPRQNPETARIRKLKTVFLIPADTSSHQDPNSLTGGAREQQGSHSNAISYLTELLISCSNLPDRVCNHEAICGNLNLEWKPPPLPKKSAVLMCFLHSRKAIDG